MEVKNKEIGEIFEYNGEMYQCVQSKECNGCAFHGDKNKCCTEVCTMSDRSDGASVIFKKLEKVGEPYEYFMQGTGIILVQEYILASQSYICEDEVIDCQKNGRVAVAIEIKQNKEDMEEKKTQHYDCFFDRKPTLKEFDKEDMEEKKTQHYDCFFDRKPTLKEFDLEAAKAGKPVCTRDGRKARIICFDRKDSMPIVALIECVNHAEFLQSVHNNGRCFHYDTSNNDLMMLPEKKEGWVNVYKGGLLDTKSYNTKKEAFDKASPEDYVDTVKINWEE